MAIKKNPRVDKATRWNTMYYSLRELIVVYVFQNASIEWDDFKGKAWYNQ